MKASAPLQTAARRPLVVVVVVVVAATPNYLRQASQNLGKYKSSEYSTYLFPFLLPALDRDGGRERRPFLVGLLVIMVHADAYMPWWALRGLVEFVPITRFCAKEHRDRANTAHAWTDGPPPATFTVR